MTDASPDADQIIRDLPLLARLPDEDVRALAAKGRLRRFAPSDIIFREGDPGDSLHVVVEGNVRMTVLSGSGEEATVAAFGPGECFGEMALLDGRPRSASATAVRATRTFVVTRQAFIAWLRDRPDAALALLETLSLRLRRTDENLSDLLFLDLPRRLAKRLLTLAAAQDQGSAPVKLQITQAELGAMLGVSRESVNKQLNQYAREGAVKLGRGSVTVIDRQRLKAYE